MYLVKIQRHSPHRSVSLKMPYPDKDERPRVTDPVFAVRDLDHRELTRTRAPTHHITHLSIKI